MNYILNQIRKEWLIYSIILILLILSLYTPLSIITLFLLAVPLILLYVRTDFQWFMALIAIQFIFFIVIQSNTIILIIFLFLLPVSIMMGIQFKQKKTTQSIIASGTGTLIMEILITLMFLYVLELKPISNMKDFLTENLRIATPSIEGYLTTEQQEQLIAYMINLVPTYIIIFSLLYVIISYLISKRVLNKIGESTPKLTNWENLKLPKVYVAVYFLGLILSQLLPMQEKGTIQLVIHNLLPLLSLIFIFQATLLIILYSKMKKWNKAVPILLILLIIVPAFNIMYTIIGILDTMTSIREKLKERIGA